MAVHHRMTTAAPGRPVLVKHADTAEDVARLVHEAAMLRAAAHPGVVGVVAEQSGADGHELHLAVPGTRTVADLRSDLAGVAGLVSALAASVADLHDLGIVHGRIRAEHVLVDGTGRPVLCGFAGAARAGEAALGSTVVLAPGDDVRALGVLLERLVGDVVERDVGPGRLRSIRSRQPSALRRALLALAAQASVEDPALRPGARALSAAIVSSLPRAGRSRRAGAAVDADDRVPPGPPGRRRAGPRRLVAPVAAAVGLGLLAFGVGGLLRPPPAGRPAAGPPAAAPTAAVPTAAVAAPAPTAMPTTTVATPATLEVGGRRYEVGRAGDLLAVGDWDCDGVETVAVVRPGTGEVYVFATWATPGSDAAASRAAVVAGAASVHGADPDGDGCPVLVVATADGRRTEVAL